MFFQAMILNFVSPEELDGYENNKEVCINKVVDVSNKGCISNVIEIIIKIHKYSNEGLINVLKSA
jgi:hypothetical protein